jgi:hypothetical protein
MRGLVAVALLGAAQAFAQSIASAPTYGESPKNMAAEISLGPYFPLIDRAFPNANPGPYQKTFGNSSMLLGQAEVERQLWQRLGTIAIGLSVGYTEKYGHATADATGMMTSEAVSLKFVPMQALIVYRFDYLMTKYNIPLVPFVKVGFELAHWWTSKGTMTPEVADGVNGLGWSYGITSAIGICFLLDILDPRLARDFDTGVGINHSYIFASYNFNEVNDFGRVTADGTKAALDLSARYPMFGLAFEY